MMSRPDFGMFCVLALAILAAITLFITAHSFYGAEKKRPVELRSYGMVSRCITLALLLMISGFASAYLVHSYERGMAQQRERERKEERRRNIDLHGPIGALFVFLMIPRYLLTFLAAARSVNSDNVSK